MRCPSGFPSRRGAGLALLLAAVTWLACAPPPEPPPEGPPLEVQVVGPLLVEAGYERGFRAAVSGTLNQAVDWSIAEGPGRISRVGGYTSNSGDTGTVVVKATSRADPRASGTLTVRLASSTAPIQAAFRLDSSGGCWDVCPYKLLFSARFSSAYEIASAVVRVPGTDREATLTYQTEDFVGQLNLESLARGSYRLELEVTDVRGNTLVTGRQFLIDGRPQVRRTSPTVSTLVTSAHPRIQASCVDDGGWCGMSFRVGGETDVFSPPAGPSLDMTLDLSAFLNQEVLLTLRAVDNLGQEGWFATRLVVVDNPLLEPVLQVPGQLVGINDAHLLYAGEPTSNGWSGLVVLRERASGRETRFEGSYALVNSISLSSKALGFERSDAGDKSAYFYDLETGTSLRRVLPAWSLAGDFVTYRSNSQAILLRIATGAEVQLPVRDGLRSYENFFAFIDTDGNVATYQDGVTRRLTDDASGAVVYQTVATDGARVLYFRTVDKSRQLLLHTGTEAVAVGGPMVASFSVFSPLLNAGWVGYSEQGRSGTQQVWLRAPDGTTRQVTDLGQPSRLLALGPRGQVVVESTGRTGNLMSVGEASGPLRELGQVPGRFVWLDGAWHVLAADTLFRVH